MPDTSNTLTLALGNAGLIQFGRFVQPDETIWPVAVNLRWLPSYPALLRQVAAALADHLPGIQADRILTTVDAIPIGVALGLQAAVPVVYPYGEVRDYTAAFAIEGAYDVGHPTLLLSDVLIDGIQAKSITALARKVGLDVGSVLSVLDLELGAHETLTAAGYRVQSVLKLREMLPILEEAGLLPPLMHAAVLDWIDG